MFNKVFAFIQDKSQFIYENSFLLQKIDIIILFFILSVFATSVFAETDVIGAFAVAVIILSALKLMLRKGEKLECCNYELFLLAYFMIVLISLFGSTLYVLSLKGFLKTLIYLGFYVSLVQFLKSNKNKIWWIIGFIACCVSFEAFIGLYQTIVRPEAISTWQDTSYLNPEDVLSRVYGTLQPLNPNLLGGYFVAGIPFLAAFAAVLIRTKHYKVAISSLILLCLSISVLFFTGCRGSYLGLFAMIALVIVLTAKYVKEQFKKRYISIVSGLTATAAAVVLSVGSLRSRIFSIFAMREDSSNAFRFNVYQSCLDMLKDNWLVGIGIGNQNFREIYGLYMKTGFDALSAYNVFLEIAVESGIFALIAFLGFIGSLLWLAFKRIYSQNEISIILIFCVVTIVGLMVHGLVDTIFFRPQIQFLFWTVVAILNIRLSQEQ